MCERDQLLAHQQELAQAVAGLQQRVRGLQLEKEDSVRAHQHAQAARRQSDEELVALR
jgi:hypothetical protein